MSPVFENRISLLAGRWVPHHGMRLSVDDAGFQQGVTVVERLRTYSGRVFAIDGHLDRWQHSVSELEITGLPSPATIHSHVEELLSRNASWLQSEGDVGITMFATPGEVGSHAPTFGLHLNRLNHARNNDRRQRGQPLIVTAVKQPDPDCWPRSIKVRSRVHYFRADAMARKRDEDAIGVLVDNDGSLTETSIANLAIVQAGQIFSPPADRVLGGITQSVIETLASQLAIPWSKKPISAAQIAYAEEILLMGTDGGIWFANSVNGHPITAGVPGNVFLLLRDRFDAFVLG